MWASCCGLLNEVMGTGTVRAQQPGFGAGAGPFRFAPSAGYSTYPPTSSGSAAQLCKACGLAFSVFRRKVSPACVCVWGGRPVNRLITFELCNAGVRLRAASPRFSRGD